MLGCQQTRPRLHPQYRRFRPFAPRCTQRRTSHGMCLLLPFVALNLKLHYGIPCAMLVAAPPALGWPSSCDPGTGNSANDWPNAGGQNQAILSRSNARAHSAIAWEDAFPNRRVGGNRIPYFRHRRSDSFDL